MTADTPPHDDSTAASEQRTRSLQAVAAPALLLAPLQRVTVERSPTSEVGVALVVALAVVGGLLTYQAVRGYRRNDDRSMALFAVGLCLLTVVHAALSLAAEFVVPAVFAGEQSVVLAVAATSQLVDVAGLVAIFYAILR